MINKNIGDSIVTQFCKIAWIVLFKFSDQNIASSSVQTEKTECVKEDYFFG